MTIPKTTTTDAQNLALLPFVTIIGLFHQSGRYLGIFDEIISPFK